MKKRRNQQGQGRIYRRPSRHTGEPLATWWIAYYQHGVQKRESAHTTDRQAALDLLRERQQGVRRGTVVDHTRDRLTIDQVLDGLLAHYTRKQLRSRPAVTSQVKPWRTAFGSRRALTVTREEIDALTAEWQAAAIPVQPSTINRRLSLLRRAFRLKKLGLEASGLDDMDERTVEETSQRGKYLAPADLEAILTARWTVKVARSTHTREATFAPGVRDFVRFAYWTGKRKSQLARTRWSYYDPTTEMLTWPAAEVKAKRDETLPLAGPALDLIHRLYAERRLHCPFVFHGPHCAIGHRASDAYGCVGDFKKSWASACQAAGFPVGRKHGGFVFHNTRHSAVTNLANAGVPVHEAMAVTGHRTRSVFDRYSIALQEQTRAALRRTADYLADQPATPTVVPLTGTTSSK